MNPEKDYHSEGLSHSPKPVETISRWKSFSRPIPRKDPICDCVSSDFQNNENSLGAHRAVTPPIVESTSSDSGFYSSKPNAKYKPLDASRSWNLPSLPQEALHEIANDFQKLSENELELKLKHVENEEMAPVASLFFDKVPSPEYKEKSRTIDGDLRFADLHTNDAKEIIRSRNKSLNDSLNTEQQSSFKPEKLSYVSPKSASFESETISSNGASPLAIDHTKDEEKCCSQDSQGDKAANILNQFSFVKPWCGKKKPIHHLTLMDLHRNNIRNSFMFSQKYVSISPETMWSASNDPKSSPIRGILCSVFSHLHPRDLARASMVSKLWNDVATHSVRWSSLALFTGARQSYASTFSHLPNQILAYKGKQNSSPNNNVNFLESCSLLERNESLPNFLLPVFSKTSIAQLYKRILKSRLQNKNFREISFDIATELCNSFTRQDFNSNYFQGLVNFNNASLFKFRKSRKAFIVKNMMMFVFSSIESPPVLVIPLLPTTTIQTLPVNKVVITNVTGMLSFRRKENVLVTSTENIMFSCESEIDRQQLIQVLKCCIDFVSDIYLSPQSPSSHPLFNVPLSAIMKSQRDYQIMLLRNQKKTTGETEIDESKLLAVPFIFEKLLSALADPTILREEGILRLSGSNTEITYLRHLFESKFSPSLFLFDRHSIADLLKTFLRSLPEPIISNEVDALFVPLVQRVAGKQKIALENSGDITDSSGINESLTMLKSIVSFLPPDNFNMFKRFTMFLRLLLAESQRNKMNDRNLGIVLQPSLRSSFHTYFFCANHWNFFFG